MYSPDAAPSRHEKDVTLDDLKALDAEINTAAGKLKQGESVDVGEYRRKFDGYKTELESHYDNPSIPSEKVELVKTILERMENNMQALERYAKGDFSEVA
jgi:hypothetical protein